MLRTVLASSLLIAAAPSLDDLRGSVTADARVERALAVVLEAESSMIEQFVGDESREAEGQLAFSLTIEAGFVDRFTAVEDGRPTTIEREFTSAQRVERNAIAGQEETEESDSPLTDRTVRFERDDDGEWDAQAVDEDEDEDFDEDWLEGLDHDADLEFLLPEGRPEEDESWSVDISELRRLTRPAGQLHFRTATPEALQTLIDDSTDALWEAIEGELEVTYAGLREVDGRELAVFDIAVQAEGEGAAEAEIDDDEQEGLRFIETRMEFDLEGQLVWDTDAGFAASFELAGEVVLGRRQGLRLEAPTGDEIELGQAVEMEGQVSVTLTTSSLDDE